MSKRPKTNEKEVNNGNTLHHGRHPKRQSVRRPHTALPKVPETSLQNALCPIKDSVQGS